jgi:outer membrane protein assembly factor BamB
MHSTGRPFSLCFFISIAAIVPVHADNWTRFRGPNGQGVSVETNLPLKWSSTENVAWKTPIPGNAWSSPIVYGDHVFLTTTTEEGKVCHVICVNRKNGDIQWNKDVYRQELRAKRAQNSYATPTPVTDGKKVYSVFSDGTVVAVDFQGEVVWRNSDVRFHSLHGLGASPLLVGDQLIMPFDGSSAERNEVGWTIPWENAVVLSLDTATGNVRWKGSRGKSRVGHVTPILVDDAKQVVSAGGDRVQGHDVNTGDRIWSIYSQGEGVTPSPALGEGLIFTSSGFEEPTIRAIRMGGVGDVTETHIAWEQKKGVPALPSLLFVRPYLYSITRSNILYCIEATSGDIVWFNRLNGAHSASPVYADGRIYILSEEGETLVLRPGAKYDEIARNTIDEKCMASMAVSQGQFFIRTAENLYCIGKPSTSETVQSGDAQRSFTH